MLSENTKITHIAIPAAADATDIVVTSTDVDMQGYDGVLYLFVTGAVGTSIIITPQVSDNASFTGDNAKDLRKSDGTSAALTIGTGGANATHGIDIANPPDRYIGVKVDKTGNCAVAVVAIQYKSSEAPITNATIATILNGTKHTSLTA